MRFPVQAVILLVVWALSAVSSRRRPRAWRLLKTASRDRVRVLARRRALLTGLHDLSFGPSPGIASPAVRRWVEAAARGTAPRQALGSREAMMAELSRRVDELEVEHGRLSTSAASRRKHQDSTIAALRQELASSRARHDRLRAGRDAAIDQAESRAIAAERDAAVFNERVQQLSRELIDTRATLPLCREATRRHSRSSTRPA